MRQTEDLPEVSLHEFSMQLSWKDIKKIGGGDGGREGGESYGGNNVFEKH